MTDLVPRRPSMTDRYEGDPDEGERATGMMIYGLYLLSPLTVGVSGLGGLLWAASKSKRAVSRLGTHFKYQVWTFGAALGAALTGGLWSALGGIASLGDRTGGGGELALAGAGLAVLSGVGFMAASIFGLSRLASHEPIGSRPR
ncbi:MAG: hypothetical protein M3M95_00580 [Pseudomonadota bacterium]|nr:hypothetical protein [Pseudomonadota bacterium]